MKRSCNLNKIMVEVWKGYGTIVIVDKCTGKRIKANITSTDKIPADYDTDIAYGANGFRRVKIAEDIFIEEKEE